MDYPVLECKEATFENFGMYLIFTLAFGLGGITALVIILQTGQNLNRAAGHANIFPRPYCNFALDSIQ